MEAGVPNEGAANSTEDEGGHGRSKPGENGEAHFGLYPVLQQPIWTVPPAGSKMPPREAFALTREMIEFRAKKKVIAVTFANFAFMDFVTNWVRHLTDYEVTNILVGTCFPSIAMLVTFIRMHWCAFLRDHYNIY